MSQAGYDVLEVRVAPHSCARMCTTCCSRLMQRAECCLRPRAGVVALCSLAALILSPTEARAQRTLHAVRNLTIDAKSHHLSVAREIVVSSSGIIAVLQPEEMRIRFFSSAGFSLGTFGRAGDGPGKFRSISSAGWNGDTLHVEDSVARRVTFIGADRRLLRTGPEPMGVTPPKGPRRPPAIRVLVGMDHSEWLEERTTEPGVHAWRILDAKGIVSGVLTVPASVVLTDVRIDTAWGTERNSAGRRDVVRFEVY